jgi:2-amino-4-hydroxy-6-hydroxymethyldihydropteridine diphosphokinase
VAGRVGRLTAGSLEMKNHVAYLSIGSNLGDKRDNCRRAVDALNRTPLTTVVAESPYYKTAPVDYTDQDWFVNAVVKIETGLDPLALLQRLQNIQREAGRLRDTVRFGPRIIDLDILFYDDAVIATGALEIPHPRMHKRRFVLRPICDIDPAIVHPVLQTSVSDLLARLEDENQRVERY